MFFSSPVLAFLIGGKFFVNCTDIYHRLPAKKYFQLILTEESVVDTANKHYILIILVQIINIPVDIYN